MSVITGTASVIGIKYKNGVMLVADKLVSYGTTARYFDIERLKKVNDSCIVGASGEYADFQELCKTLEELEDVNFAYGDEHHVSPKGIHSYVTRQLYYKRKRIEPYAVNFVVAGMDDIYGTPFTANFITTGISQHIGRALIAKKAPEFPNMSRDEAKKFLMEIMSLLYLRHKLSYCDVEIRTVEYDEATDSVKVSEPETEKVDTSGKWHSTVTVHFPI